MNSSGPAPAKLQLQGSWQLIQACVTELICRRGRCGAAAAPGAPHATLMDSKYWQSRGEEARGHRSSRINI